MIGGIVLAAGASRRLGRPKQLLPLGGRPLLEWTLVAMRAFAPAQLVLVLGYEADAILRALDCSGLQVVLNARYADGQSTSLHAGLQVLQPDIEAAVIATCDQPFLLPSCFAALQEAWSVSGLPIIATDYGSHSGVPLLLARSSWPLVDGISGDQGARALLRGYPALVAHVAAPDPRMALDVDTDEDYAQVVAQLEGLSGDRRAGT